LWTEALTEAFVRVNTLEQMLDDLPSWKQAASREQSYLEEVVTLLMQPDRELAAIGIMLRRSLEGGAQVGSG
jgi:hypothetical protein